MGWGGGREFGEKNGGVGGGEGKGLARKQLHLNHVVPERPKENRFSNESLK